MDHYRFARLVRDEFRHVTLPTGPRRCWGDEKLLWSFEQVQRSIEWLAETADTGGWEPAYKGSPTGIDYSDGRAIDVASHLWAAGASPEEYRHWASLAALGLFLARRCEAMEYALLAGEYSMARGWSGPSPEPDYYAQHILWALGLGQQTIPERETYPRDRETVEPWTRFFHGMQTRDASQVEGALCAITEIHIGQYLCGDESDFDPDPMVPKKWLRFEPLSYALYDPMACAAAAVARRAGLVRELPALAAQYLEPGLSPGDPPPIFPTHSPW